MNILMFLRKNTAALDFAIPLLWKIKQVNPQASVSVLYWTLSRKKILRESRFYTDVFKQCGVPQYDFADFLQAPYVALSGLWRGLCSKSNPDSSPWDRRLRHFPGGRLVAHYMWQYLNMLENFLASKLRVQQILPSLSPDIVLFDNTIITRFYRRQQVYSYLSSVRKKVILLPHAPHHASTTAFTPFDKEGEELPDYCEFWMPFKFDRAWERLPERKSQFAYVGYPGLDSEWLEQLESGGQLHSTGKPRSSRAGEPLRCLFIIRQFLPKGRTRTPNSNAFHYDYDEFSYYINLIGNSLKSAVVDIELIVKPHPSNDFETLKEVFIASELPRWRIVHDPIYAILSECDFVISLYSTILLIPAMIGIPTILLHTSTQSVVHQEDTMKQLYTGLHFYLENPEDLPLRLKEVIEIASERRWTNKPVWKGDVEHLRQFYPDGAMQRCLDRLGI